jgi:hypothetical protein
MMGRRIQRQPFSPENYLANVIREAVEVEREACARTMESYSGFTPDERRIAAAAIRARKP